MFSEDAMKVLSDDDFSDFNEFEEEDAALD